MNNGWTCFCINRNILECKVFTSTEKSNLFICVLIETYWNVKKGVVLDSDC